MSDPRLLVTGGAGFIGSAVVRMAVRAGYSVLNLDKLTYAGNLGTVAEVAEDPRYDMVQGDIADASLVRRLLQEFAPTAVLHLAAESHVDRSIDGPREFIETNIVGTFTLLDEALRYWRALSPALASAFRFVQVSTDEVYGSLGADGRFTEESQYRPNSPYSASKAAGDHLARAWFHTYGLPVVITNCTNNYGPFQFPEKLIPLVIQRALADEPVPVYGQGDNVRDWLFVEDHVDALLAVLRAGRPGEVYGIGGGAERRNIDVVRAICAACDRLAPSAVVGDRSSLIAFVRDRPGHDFRYAMDTSKIATELGWTPRHSFDSGLERTVQWYLEHPEWATDAQRASGYAGERLGHAVAQ